MTSRLVVNSIRHTGSSSDAVTLASDGTCTANITNNLSNRNLIINGAMQVAQRGTSATSSGYHTVDRFECSFGGTDEAPTQAQVDIASGTTPYTLGFRKAYKVTNGNQTGGGGTGDYIYLRQRIESQNVANSGWNYTSTSSFITLSFYVKSSVAQNFYGYLRAGTSKMYPFQTGSLSADTWTKITKTISGHADIVFNNNNGTGIGLVIAPFFGTDFTANSATVDVWKANSDTERMPDNTSTWYTTNDATFEITGMQLEVGSVATDFEHRSFAQELALCQRYYQRIAEGNGKSICENATQFSSAYLFMSIPLPVAMRAAPTLEDTNASNHFIRYDNGSSSTFNTFGLDGVTTTTLFVISADVSGTAGSSCIVRTNSNNAFVAAVSEL